uniref:protein disulfide-isomerase n=1 Tax=Vitrella brassicaformis TaxID=1169539 RepID=A0A7S1K0G4_9ALVE
MAYTWASDGYPALILFNKGFWLEYDGSRTADAMIEWLTFRIQRGLIELTAPSDLHMLREDEETAVVGFFNNTVDGLYDDDDFQEFARGCGDYRYAYSFDGELAPEGQLGIYFHSRHPPRWQRWDREGYTTHKTRRRHETAWDGHHHDAPDRDTTSGPPLDYVHFCDRGSIPLVPYWSPVDASRYGDGAFEYLVFVFMSKRSDEEAFTAFRDDLETLIQTLRSRDGVYEGYLLVLVDIDEAPSVGWQFGIDASSALPAVGAFRPSDERKFVPSQPMTPSENDDDTVSDGQALEDIGEFVRSMRQGTARSLIVSEEVPTQGRDPPGESLVQRVAGSTFDAAVMQTANDVLLYVYTEWCGMCKNMFPVIYSLADKLRNMNVTTLTFAAMDGGHNEHPALPAIDGYPTLLLYRAHSKDRPIEYREGRSVQALATWLQYHVSQPFHPWPPTWTNDDLMDSEALHETDEDTCIKVHEDGG